MVPSAQGDEWTSSSIPTPLALGRFGSVRFGLVWVSAHDQALPGGDTIKGSGFLVGATGSGGNGVYCFMISQSTIPYYNLSGAFVFLCFMMVYYYGVSCFVCFCSSLL
jgi:hypothetical protein